MRKEGGWRRAWALCLTIAALVSPKESAAGEESCAPSLCTVEATPGSLIPSCCVFELPKRFPTHISASAAAGETLLLGSRDGAVVEISRGQGFQREGAVSADLKALPGFDSMHPELHGLHLHGNGEALAATRGQLFVREGGTWSLRGMLPDIAPGALWAGPRSYLFGGREGLYCVGRDARSPKRLPFQRLPGPNIGALAVSKGILYLGLWRGGILHLPLNAEESCGGLSPSSPDGVSWAQSPLPFSSRVSVTSLLPRGSEGLVGLGSGGVLRGIKGSRPFLEPDVQRVPGDGGPRPYDPVVGLHKAPGGSWLVYTDRVLQLGLDGEVLESWDGAEGLDISSTLGALSYVHPTKGPLLLVGQSALFPVDSEEGVASTTREPEAKQGGDRSIWLIGFLFALAGFLFFLGRSGDRRQG